MRHAARLLIEKPANIKNVQSAQTTPAHTDGGTEEV